MTSQLQSLDVCINKLFKDAIKHRYLEWMRSGDPKVTASERLKQASPAILGWIVHAWASICEELISYSFKEGSGNQIAKIAKKVDF